MAELACSLCRQCRVHRAGWARRWSSRTTSTARVLITANISPKLTRPDVSADPHAAIGARKRQVVMQLNTDVTNMAKRRRVEQDASHQGIIILGGGDIQLKQENPHHRAGASSGPQTNGTTEFMSIDDLLQEIKNKAAFEVSAKECELEELRLEVGHLIQTVQGHEATIGTLEADKATLHDSLQKKFISLSEKVAQLLEDHKAIGPFINSTTAELSRWHRHRKETGPAFKDAMTKYEALIDQQRRMQETIRSTKEEAAVEFVKLISAHAQKSEKILVALQAEKRLVEAEKQKFAKLKECLNREELKV